MKRNRYTDSELEFQKVTVNENRTGLHIGSKRELKYTTVLDLKCAFNMVPTETSMNVVKHKRPQSLGKMKRSP